jgi:membrane protease YdiL (CAAX protease family)
MTSLTPPPSRARLHSIGRTALLVTAMLVVMIGVNAIASAFTSPLVALVVGPGMGVLVLWLYAWAVRRFEKRPVDELARPRAVTRLLGGAAGGLGLAAVTIGTIALLGGYQVIGWGTIAGALTIVGMMCAVAVAEEVLFRGMILRLLQQRLGTWIALAGSAVLFGLIHLLNPGATLWGAVAIAVEAGLMLGAAFVATGSLWLPIGLHLGWNVALAAIFGTLGATLGFLNPPPEAGLGDRDPKPQLTVAHKLMMAFCTWVCLSYVTAQYPEVAWPWFQEYLKIFLMFLIASTVVRTL